MLERLFHLHENGATVRGELVAGLTTFAAMAYILAVNPFILGNTGMDTGAVLTATALAAAFTTLAMGLASNYPLALAPGMGLTCRLRRRYGMRLLTPAIRTSPRKHLEQGRWRKTLTNVAFLLLYTCGVAPGRLHGWYYRRRHGRK